MSADLLIRLVYFAAFLLAGFAAYRRGSGLTQAAHLCGEAGDDARVQSALLERERLENVPWGRLRVLLIGASLVAAALALIVPLSAFGYVYGAYALVSAAAAGALAIVMRARGGRRAAPLRRRDLRSYSPWWIRSLICVGVVSPLCYIDVAPAQALFVTMAGVLIACAGGAISAMPALLGGVDPAIEELLDERLRRARAMTLFCLAPVTALVFESVSGFTGSPLRAVAFGAVVLSFIPCCVFVLKAPTPRAGGVPGANG